MMLQLLVHGVELLVSSVFIAFIVIRFMSNFERWCTKKTLEIASSIVYWVFALPLMLHIMVPHPAASVPAAAFKSVAPPAAMPQPSRPSVLYPSTYKGPDMYGVPQHK